MKIKLTNINEIQKFKKMINNLRKKINHNNKINNNNNNNIKNKKKLEKEKNQIY